MQNKNKSGNQSIIKRGKILSNGISLRISWLGRIERIGKGGALKQLNNGIMRVQKKNRHRKR